MKNPQEFPEDHWGKSSEKKASLYQHKKSRNIYRIVGSCINKDTDKFCVLYRKWDDFGDVYDSLYCREWATFEENFEKYEFSRLEVVPTEEQADIDLKSLLRRA